MIKTFTPGQAAPKEAEFIEDIIAVPPRIPVRSRIRGSTAIAPL